MQSEFIPAVIIRCPNNSQSGRPTDRPPSAQLVTKRRQGKLNRNNLQWLTVIWPGNGFVQLIDGPTEKDAVAALYVDWERLKEEALKHYPEDIIIIF